MSTIDASQPDAQVQELLPAQDTRPRHRWTVADYHKMGKVGLLSQDARVELIDGEIVEMAPIGSQHAGQVNHLVGLLWNRLYGKAVITGQNPVLLGDYGEPQPDIAVLRWRDDYYKSAHPKPEDILLLIEVADTTARYDREVKVPLYARHNILEVWLLDLPQQHLEVYRDPADGKYTQVSCHRTGLLSPRQFPEAVVELADLFPQP
jgi:Uma2 family endonuclease